MPIVLNGTTGITTPTIAATSASTFTGALALPAGGLNVGSGQLAVDASGRVTKANQPAFRVFRNSAALQGVGVVLFNLVQNNNGGHYNAANGRFTAPVSGYYFLEVSGGNSSTHGCDLKVNGSAVTRLEVGSPPAYQWNSSCVVTYMNANDFADVFVFTGSMNFEPGYGHFSGFLIG